MDFARNLQDSGLTWVEANNAIYGPGGRFVKLFPTKTDRVAFARTDESRKIDELIDRVPKSLHAALAAEAEVEGVSLNQLVVAKLAVQLSGSVK